ncbi:TolC family protein [Dyella nitratireducens]|uniref:Protein CyaE n=1 Tax=Dyella nitratireducens TaxID=1849580 RepID=A0ABQ1GEK8_9GAMM|nr:TolC family protein [Dyella nitratireducens]GGA42208.1 protein CyaE [Dyella nitratireducens]GLQ42036.1 protein CyaE [Dyella nitratireducens]
MRRARSESPLLAHIPLALAIVLFVHSGMARTQSASWAMDTTSHADAPAMEDRVYTLQELLTIALDISPKTREVEQEAVQADLAVRLAKTQYSPQLDAKALGGIQRTPLAIPPTVSKKGYFVSSTREVFPTLEMKWLLFDFGRRKGAVEEARHNASAAQSGLLGAQEKLVFDVSEAYFDATSAQGQVRAAQKSLDAAKLTEQAVADQKKHGRATVVQLAEAQRQTAAMQLGLTKANGTADTAFATLVATIGLPPETRFEVAPPADAPTTETLAPLRTLIDEALQTRPDVLAATDKVAAAGAKIETARAAYRPTISLSAQLFQNIGKISSDGSPYSSIDRTGNALFVSFDWPLFDGGARATNVSLAVSQKTEAEDALADTKDTASQQVVQAYSNLKTSLDNRNQALAYTHASELAYQASLDSYRRGLTSITDLTSNEAVLAQAEAGQEDADANVGIARAALDLALGRRPSSH